MANSKSTRVVATQVVAVESPKVAPQFVEALANKCESVLEAWLRVNAPQETRDLWSSIVWLRHYVTASRLNGGNVAAQDNREIADLVIEAVNSCLAAGGEFVA